jgi:Helix-turn-helix domain
MLADSLRPIDAAESDSSAAWPRFFTTAEASRYLNIPSSTLEKMRVTGTGPVFVRYGTKSVRYRMGDLEAWLRTRLCRTSSDHRQAAM